MRNRVRPDCTMRVKINEMNSRLRNKVNSICRRRRCIATFLDARGRHWQWGDSHSHRSLSQQPRSNNAIVFLRGKGRLRDEGRKPRTAPTWRRTIESWPPPPPLIINQHRTGSVRLLTATVSYQMIYRHWLQTTQNKL